MLKKLAVAGMAAFLLCALSEGQDNKEVKEVKDRKFDVSASFGATLSKSSSGNGINLTVTKGTDILGSIRLKISKRSSLEVNYGRARNSQLFDTSPLQYRIQGPITEFTGAYVFRPRKRWKFEPFVLGGAGVLVFAPDKTYVFSTLTNIPALRQIRPAFLYGGGADYPLRWHFALRVQYRGVFYRAPDYKMTSLFSGGTGHMGMATAGIVFKF